MNSAASRLTTAPTDVFGANIDMCGRRTGFIRPFLTPREIDATYYQNKSGGVVLSVGVGPLDHNNPVKPHDLARGLRRLMAPSTTALHHTIVWCVPSR